jgi:hypothetical protein
MHNLFKNVKVTQALGFTSVATTTDIYSTGIDMEGFQGVAFIASIIGTPTSAGFLLKAEECVSSAFSTALTGEIGGSAVNVTTAIADGFLILDVYRPTKRYVRAIMDRVTTDDEIGGILAFQYKASHSPVTHATGDLYAAEYLNGTSSGTAT